jgi:hypothetical protein
MTIGVKTTRPQMQQMLATDGVTIGITISQTIIEDKMVVALEVKEVVEGLVISVEKRVTSRESVPTKAETDVVVVEKKAITRKTVPIIKASELVISVEKRDISLETVLKVVAIGVNRMERVVKEEAEELVINVEEKDISRIIAPKVVTTPMTGATALILKIIKKVVEVVVVDVEKRDTSRRIVLIRVRAIAVIMNVVVVKKKAIKRAIALKK